MKTPWIIAIMVVIAAGLTLLLISSPQGGGVDGDWVTTKSGLKYEDMKVGKGQVAEPGDKVFVHYTGTLTNGKKFDSSLDRGEPFDFVIGQSQVIQGWHEGVAGMKVGGKRRLLIPAKLAYGERGSGNAIPPNSDLVFEIDLLQVK